MPLAWVYSMSVSVERTRTLNLLRDGRVRVLVATDVAARGIDVPGINLVVNYDAPRMAEDYVHRIGRTGRAGRAGIAVTFIGQGDHSLMRQVERFTGNKMSLMEIPGLEPSTRAETAPRKPFDNKAGWRHKSKGYKGNGARNQSGQNRGPNQWGQNQRGQPS